MTTRLDSLAQERRALAEEIGRSRHELTRAAQSLQRPLHRIETLQRDARYLRDNYSLLLLPAALLVLLNPRRSLRLAALGLVAWNRFRLLEGPPAERAVHALLHVLARRP